MKRQSIRLVVLILIFVSNRIFATTASFQGLGWLEGGDYGHVEAISDDGTVVVGTSRSTFGVQAFRWTATGGMVGLGCLPGDESSNAYDISADGKVIVGDSYTLTPSYIDTTACFWNAEGDIVNLGEVIGGVDSSAMGISDDGSVVVGCTDIMNWEAFRWSVDEGMVGLGFLPGNYHTSYGVAISGDGSVVIGEAHNANRDIEAFRWTADGGMVGLGDLEGGRFESHASDVSDDGSVIVGWGASHELSPCWEAFRWTSEEGMVGLGYLSGAFWSRAYAVTGDGSTIVGRSNDKAILWTSGNGMICIQELLEDNYGLNLDGWTLYNAVDVSDDGLTIVGMGLNPHGDWEGWIATIPEPATLFLLGLAAAVLLRRHNS